jgi:hypothetical protein
VAELTVRINDEGWEGSLAAWLRASRLAATDALLVLSVGGDDESRGVSVNLIRAIEHARAVGARVAAIVGRVEGYAARQADAAVVVPRVAPERVTPHSESFRAVVWHPARLAPAASGSGHAMVSARRAHHRRGPQTGGQADCARSHASSVPTSQTTRVVGDQPAGDGFAGGDERGGRTRRSRRWRCTRRCGGAGALPAAWAR